MQNRFLFLFLAWILIPSSVNAQAREATVINHEALVYQNADFDAPVIATLKIGSVYKISTGRKGPFYKIRLKPGMVGWIADTDIKPGIHRYMPDADELKPESTKSKKQAEAQKPKKPFHATRYRGVSLNYINFTENTLGEKRSDLVPFFGLNMHGNDTLMDGEIYIDANFIMAFSAPKYYSDYTGKDAAGYIFIADFLFQMVSTRGRDVLFYYGFGPMAKYSQFQITSPNGPYNVTYAADDIAIGGVFNLGVSVRAGDFTLRPDFKYYWEKESYYGVALTLGHEF